MCRIIPEHAPPAHILFFHGTAGLGKTVLNPRRAEGESEQCAGITFIPFHGQMYEKTGES